jgi:hypothetical protein
MNEAGTLTPPERDEQSSDGHIDATELGGRAAWAARSEALAGTISVFQRLLHLPDPPDYLYGVLGAVAANYLPGDPLWLFVVGASSGGKTEVLRSLSTLEGVREAATLTEGALLSGAPKREHAENATGGLLREIGESGIILAKDFGSVMSMNKDAQQHTLAALREIYDGKWTRAFGTDGGRRESWTGKVGLIGGCTPVIDRQHAVMSEMGQRFVLMRLPIPKQEARREQGCEQARRALDNAGSEDALRDELAGAVKRLFDWAPNPPSEPRPGGRDRQRLAELAQLVAVCRSTLERDSYTREVVGIAEPEGPARLAKQLAQLWSGLQVLGASEEITWRVVTKAGVDSIPTVKRLVIRQLGEDDRAVKDVAVPLHLSQSTVRRTLEDLHAHGVVTDGETDKALWSLEKWVDKDLFRAR